MKDGGLEKFPWRAVGGVLLAYALILCIHIDRAWIGAHDWNGAAWATAARNLLRRPLTETHGGVSLHHGDGPLERDTFYVHHPPLIVWSMAAAFRLFGESEWAGRLPSILFSLSGAACLAGLLFAAAGRSAAVIGAILFVSTPSQMYYGRMPNHEPLGLPAMIAASWAAWRWRERPTWANASILAFPLAVGCWSCWDAYFFAAILGLASLRISDRTRYPLFAVAAATAGLSLTLFLIYIRAVRPDAWTELLAAFGLRTAGVPLLEWLGTIGRFQVKLLSPVGVALLAGGAFALFRRASPWLSHDFKLLIFLPLLGAGLANVALFRQGSFVHEYYCYYLAAAAAVFGGRFVGGSWSLGKTARETIRPLVWLVLGAHVLDAAVVLAGLHGQQSIFCASGQPESATFVKKLGGLIAQEFPANAGVIVDMLPHGEHLAYYADRRLEYLQTFAVDPSKADLRGLSGAVVDLSSPAAEGSLTRLEGWGALRRRDATIEGRHFRILVFERF